jgi:hypothetical protein
MRNLLTMLAVLGVHGVLAGCALDETDDNAADEASVSDDASDLTSRFPSGRNPVPGWHPSRVDQGVDGTLPPAVSTLRSRSGSSTRSRMIPAGTTAATSP